MSSLHGVPNQSGSRAAMVSSAVMAVVGAGYLVPALPAPDATFGRWRVLFRDLSQRVSGAC